MSESDLYIVAVDTNGEEEFFDALELKRNTICSIIDNDTITDQINSYIKCCSSHTLHVEQFKQWIEQQKHKRIEFFS